MRFQPNGWMRQGFSALALVVAIALGAHLVWTWLGPLLPVVPVVVVLFVVFWILFRGWRR
jgi:hypothetical protein